MIPPIEFVGSVKENLLKFLWNDGTAKIKYNSIIIGKYEGGSNVQIVFGDYFANNVGGATI